MERAYRHKPIEFSFDAALSDYQRLNKTMRSSTIRSAGVLRTRMHVMTTPGATHVPVARARGSSFQAQNSKSSLRLYFKPVPEPL